MHQSCVKPYPPIFPAGFFWYGGNRRGPGRPPKWVEQFLTDNQLKETNNENYRISASQGNHTSQDDVPHETASSHRT